MPIQEQNNKQELEIYNKSRNKFINNNQQSNVNKTEETIRDENGLMVIVIEWNERETNNEEE